MRHRLLFLAILVFVFCAAAPAAELVVDQTTISASALPGHTNQKNALTINSSGAPLSGISISASTSSGGNWLGVTPANSTSTPVLLLIFLDARSLSPGVYNGSIKISATGAATVTVPVKFTVETATSGSFSVDTSSLSFTGQAGGSAPASQKINVSSNPAGASFSVTSTPSWVQVSPTSATTPAAITVTLNTAGITAGSYSGTVTLTPSTGNPVDVSIALRLTSSSALGVDTTGLQFYSQAGSPPPGSQSFNVSGGTAPISFNVTTSLTEGAGWLSATPASGTTPQTVTVSVAPGTLASGVYHGKVTVAATNAANGSVDVPVTLTVSSQALLTIGPPPATFVYQTGGSAPASQTVALGSSGNPLSFTINTNTSDGGSWLAVTPGSGTTPQNLTIAVNPVSLAPGSYSGTVVVSAANAVNSPLSIPVTLTVASSSSLTASAPSVFLNYQIGGVNELLNQPVTVTSTSGSVMVTATATTSAASCGPNWLQVFPASFTTPGTINITLNPAGFSQPQNCLGSIVLSGGGAPVQIPVTANVARTPFLNIRPLSAALTAPYQSETVLQLLDLSTTDNVSVQFTVTVATAGSGPWLFATPVKGSTPATVAISASPNLLGVGNYSGTVTITSTSSTQSQVVIPVSLNVTPTTTATLNPASIVFTQTPGGSPPAAQTVNVSATGGPQPFTAAVVAGGAIPSGVLSVAPATGNTPSGISISILPNTLPAGSYDSMIAVSLPAAGSSPAMIPVTLKVTNTPPPPSGIAATPAALSFSYQQNGDVPGTQQLNVTAAGTAAMNVTAAAAAEGDGKWLAVTPASNATPGSFTIAVDPATLAPGAYNGTVTLTPASGTPLVVPVRLNVAAPAVVTPKILAIANSASGVRGAISPGQIVTIGGDGLGPAIGVPLAFTAGGTVDTTAAGTQVFFDETAAPLLYTSARQINAIVPYEIAGRAVVAVTVARQGMRSEGYVIQVGGTAPGLFTATQNGRGQGAILNQDNSYNSSAQPAARGSIVQIFGTGEGVMVPPATTGSVTQALHTLAGKVTASVGGVPAEVVFAGAAPQAVAGLFQINVRIPQNVLSGDVPLTIAIGGGSTQTGVTVAVE